MRAAPASKAEIQHQPHGCRVTRAVAIGRHAGVSGLDAAHNRRVRRGKVTRLGFIHPRASGEKSIAALVRDDHTAFFEQIEDIRAAGSHGFHKRRIPVFVREQGSAP